MCLPWATLSPGVLFHLVSANKNRLLTSEHAISNKAWLHKASDKNKMWEVAIKHTVLLPGFKDAIEEEEGALDGAGAEGTTVEGWREGGSAEGGSTDSCGRFKIAADMGIH